MVHVVNKAWKQSKFKLIGETEDEWHPYPAILEKTINFT